MKAEGVLESLGIRLRDNEGKRALLVVLNELQKAPNGNSEAAQEAAKIFDTRAITAILNMTDKSNETRRGVEEQREGAAKAYADQITREDLQRAQTALGNAWRDLAGTLSKEFVGQLTTATNALADLLRDVDRFFASSGAAKIVALQNLFALNPFAGNRALQEQLEAGFPALPQQSGGRAGTNGIPAALITPFTKPYLEAVTTGIVGGQGNAAAVSCGAHCEGYRVEAALDAAVAASDLRVGDGHHADQRLQGQQRRSVSPGRPSSPQPTRPRPRRNAPSTTSSRTSKPRA